MTTQTTGTLPQAAANRPVPPGNRGRVLLSCIGFNPASTLVCARHFQVGRAILVATEATCTQMQAVAVQLGVPCSQVIVPSADASIGEVAAKLRQHLPQSAHEEIILDLTGGTKLLSLGAWNAAGQATAGAIRAAYLRPDGELFDPVRGEPIAQQVRLGIDEVLAWHGTRVRQSDWRGQLHQIAPEVRVRAALTKHLISAFDLKNFKIPPNSNAATFNHAGAMPTSLPSGFTRVGNQLTSTVPGYFDKNKWLEEYCLERAAIVLAGCSITDAAAGLVTVRGEKGIDESDIVLVRGPRVCIIEAKARNQEKGAGADLQKRIAKAHEYFGSHAHVIFVHPIWGKQPSKHLLPTVNHDHVSLIGSDTAALDHAIARALLPAAAEGSAARARPGLALRLT